MATRIGGLYVELGAETAQFRRDMSTAQRISQRSSSRISRSLDNVNRSQVRLRTGLTRLVGAFALLAGARGIGGAIRSAISYGAAVVNTANRLGLSTSALQEYRFVASQVGVEQNTLDLALQRFTRRVAEAQAGTGELAGTLERYGIAVKSSSGENRSVEAVLYDVADAIAAATTEQEKLLIAFKAFDSEGAAFVNALKGGSEELERIRQLARSTGQVISDAELNEARALDDKLDVTIGSLEAGWRKILFALIPLIDWFADILHRIPAAFESVLKYIGDYTGVYSNPFGELVGDIKDTRKEIKDLEEELADHRAAAARRGITSGLLTTIAGREVLLEEGVLSLLSQSDEFFETYNEGITRDTQEVIDDLDRARRKLASQTNMARMLRAGSLDTRPTPLQPIPDRYAGGTSAAASAEIAKIEKAAREEAQRAYDDFADSFEQTSSDMTNVVRMHANEQLAFVRSTLDLGLIDEKTAAKDRVRILARMNADIAELERERVEEAEKIRKDEIDKATEAWERHLRDIEDAADDTISVIDELGFTFESAFEKAIRDGGEVRDILAGIVSDIQAILARRYITEPALDLFNEGLDYIDSVVVDRVPPVPPPKPFPPARSSSGVDGGLVDYMADGPNSFSFRSQGGQGMAASDRHQTNIFNIDARGADREGLVAVAAQVNEMNGKLNDVRFVGRMAAEGFRREPNLRSVSG